MGAITSHVPTDDDGLWFCDLPGAPSHVQIESSSGMCPFLVEHDFSTERIHGATVEEVSSKVVEALIGRTHCMP